MLTIAIADRTAPIGCSPAAGRSQHLGWFRFYFYNDKWTWSPQVERMHGYRPGTTAPSTLLVLSHVHLDDYRDVAALLHDARDTLTSFSSVHRIVDTGLHVHRVALIGAPFHDAGGTAIGVQGLWLELSATSGGSTTGQRAVRAATQC